MTTLTLPIPVPRGPVCVCCTDRLDEAHPVGGVCGDTGRAWSAVVCPSCASQYAAATPGTPEHQRLVFAMAVHQIAMWDKHA